MDKGISVVICCYNSESRIQKVLSCLQNQNITKPINWEVVVIDNASTDETAAVAKDSWNLEGVKLRVVPEPNPGISHARRKGFEDARFEIISFVDDDNWVEEDWIEKVHDTMYTHPDIGILGGLGRAAFDEEPPAWFKDFEAAYAVGPQAEQSGPVDTRLYGAGMNIRISVWEYLKENGFEFQLTGRKGKELSSGEDSELSQAVLLSGKMLYYRSDLAFEHFMPSGRLTWDYLIKLGASFGRSEPILGIYRSLVRGDKDFQARKYQNRFFSLLRSSMDIIKFLPRQLSLMFKDKPGLKDHYRSVYIWHSFKEKLSLYGKFPSMVAEIRNGGWNKQSHQENSN